MKTLKKFEFKEFGGRSTYDWDKWLDGGIYQLEEGSDYTCKTQTLRMLAAKQARRLGKTVRTAKVENGLVIQAVEASDEQKAAWAAAEDEANGEE